MKRPDLEDYKEKLDQQVERWVEKTVRPYAQSLLDQAARRMHRHSLEYTEGMGACFYSVNGNPHHHLTDGTQWGQLAPKGRCERLAKRFPELVELMELCLQLTDLFNVELGDLEPTTTHTTNP